MTYSIQIYHFGEAPPLVVFKFWKYHFNIISLTNIKNFPLSIYLPNASI